MTIDLASIFLQLGIALGLGLLVGLQREHVTTRLAGVRTFPLVTILGALCGLLAQGFGGWIFAAGLLALTGIIVIGNLAELRAEKLDPGVTTEVAMLLMFVIGAYLVVGRREVAIALGAAVAILLQFKGELHGVARKLGENDLRAIMQFALISCIILPVLPNKTYGPYAVINPRNIWLMVVLIVGISLSGYIAYRFFGNKVGVVLGGILGGLVSSTATTVSYSRRTTDQPKLSRVAAVIIATASTILYFRILLEIATVAPRLLWSAAPPILALALVLAVSSIILWFRRNDEPDEMPPLENPSELKPALVFGVIYAIVLFAVAAVRDSYGNRGLLVVALLSGLTDVDAITLSISQLVNTDRLDESEAWRLIVAASLSNLVFKGAIIGALGHRSLMTKIILPYFVTLVAGAVMVLFWPQ
jgi:uncharacterized membrane protein (DUF4010 family)